MAKFDRTRNAEETPGSNEGTEFNANAILAEKEKQEEELRKNANLLPEGVQEQDGISIVSGQYKLVARPKSGEKSFDEKLTAEQIAAGQKPRKIKFKNINAFILTGAGKPATKPGQVRMEILPLDFARLIENSKQDHKFKAMANLMIDEEKAKAVSVGEY